MDDAVAALRAFNRFHTRLVGALDAHYLDSDLNLAEARLLYELANRQEALAAGVDAARSRSPKQGAASSRFSIARAASAPGR